jgi:hypothetical protein
MELSLSDLKSLITTDDPATVADDGGFSFGQKVFIRTVTNYYLGVVHRVTPTTVVLSSASWVADTGRFSDMLKTGVINEVEPYVDKVHVSRGAIVDHTPWQHSLPTEQK